MICAVVFTKSCPRFRCTLALNPALSVAPIESPRYGGPLQVMASPLQFSSCGYCACGYNLSLFTWNMKLSCFSCCVLDCSQCLYCCGQDLVSWYTAIRYVKLCRLCRAYPLSAVNEVNNNSLISFQSVGRWFCCVIIFMVLLVLLYAVMEIGDV